MALDKNFPQTFNGELFFFPSGPNPLNPTSPCVDGCSDFQNFLLGQPGFSFGGSGVSNHEYRINDYGLFFQDDYKATPNLTINAGLRWELFGAAKDNLCHIGNTVSALVQPADQRVYLSQVRGQAWRHRFDRYRQRYHHEQQLCL